MRLRTSITAGKDADSWGSTVVRGGNDLVGRIRIDREKFEVDSGDWGSFLVIKSRSTFQSCLMRISHAIEVTLGVSQGLSDDIHVRFPPLLYVERNTNVKVVNATSMV